MSERENLYYSALLYNIVPFWEKLRSGFHLEQEKSSGDIIVELLKDSLVHAIIFHGIPPVDLGEKNVTNLSAIVSHANALARGTLEQTNQSPSHQPVDSIFPSIGFSENSDKRGYVQIVSPLTPSGYKFPKEKNLQQPEFDRKRMERFLEELTLLHEVDKETILYLLKKYLWCISSSYDDCVSLYEHSRLTAAIACCLYDYLIDQFHTIESIQQIENDNEERYLFVAGDITGIQKFIYNIAHQGALKSLKGRSFFLQQLVESIAHSILDKFALPFSNQLYASGGTFYLLLPNTSQVKAGLGKFHIELNKNLINEYDGELGITFGTIPLMGKDFYKGNISRKWEEAGAEVKRNKQRKFFNLFNEQFFQPEGPFGGVITCNATGKDICTIADVENRTGAVGKLNYEKIEIHNVTSKKTVYRVPLEIIEEGVQNATEYRKYICEEQYIAQCIGNDLKAAPIINYRNDDGYPLLGIERFKLYGIPRDVPDDSRNERTLMLNDDDFLKFPHVEKCGWKFYGGNWTIDTFEEIIEKSVGIKRLGVLRMDVDNLGKIFREGLGEKASISHVVQLSTMLDFFFSSYLNILQNLNWDVVNGVGDKGDTRIGDVLQIVYAGGDDMFIVGVWNVLPDVAWWIREKFREFTCNNEHFTLSAGISLFPEKFPIYKAAEEAGYAEEAAKNFLRNKRIKETEKDAICLFDTPMSWHDFNEVRTLKNNLYQWIETGESGIQLSRSILNRLSLIYEEYRADKKTSWSKWRWRACYYLARFGKQYEGYKTHIDALAAELFTTTKTEQDFISLLNVPVRWVELLTRKENEE